MGWLDKLLGREKREGGESMGSPPTSDEGRAGEGMGGREGAQPGPLGEGPGGEGSDRPEEDRM